jgi:Tripartite tricarboxylate transporter family receptor
VVNQPGAGGNTASGITAASAADGYTLLVVGTGFIINPIPFAKVPYDHVLADVQKRPDDLGFEIVANTPEEFAASRKRSNGVRSLAMPKSRSISKRAREAAGSLRHTEHVLSGFPTLHNPAKLGVRRPTVAALPKIRTLALTDLPQSTRRRRVLCRCARRPLLTIAKIASAHMRNSR